MAATVICNIDTGVLTSGHGTTVATAEGGITHGTDGLVTSTATIAIPATATTTNFSWGKWLSLNVTGGTATNHIVNRTVKLASSIATGLHSWFKFVASGAYVQPVAVIAAQAASNGATPAGFTECISASATQYDNTSGITTTGQNGGYAQMGLGVDNLYVLGGGTGAVPSLTVAYDEGP